MTWAIVAIAWGLMAFGVALFFHGVRRREPVAPYTVLHINGCICTYDASTPAGRLAVANAYLASYHPHRRPQC